MSDKHEQEAELIETADPESAADPADDTDNGEQTQESLDLEDDKSENEVDKGEEQKQKKIASYQKKIDRGEITIESLPKDEKWIAEYLTPKKVEVQPIIDEEAIEKVLTKREEAKLFQAKKEQLANADLPSDKIKKLNEKFKLYRSKGMSELDAVNEAIEVAQIDLDEAQVSKKRSAMKLPKPGGKSIAKDYDKLYEELPFSEAVKVIPPDKLDEILRKSARRY